MRGRARDLTAWKSEFRALHALHHHNLVTLYELIEDGEQLAFTMELVEGATFLAWVRPEGRLDEARLRAALRALALALAELHVTGRVHGELRPANVLVEPSSRVVLLHAGLIGAGGRAAAASPALAASADAHSLGGLLCEALTGAPVNGVLPGTGSALTTSDAALLNATDAPADLLALARALLAPDPQLRPDERALLERVGARRPEPKPAGGSFVGRSRELLELHQSVQAARGGASVSVFVRGESGVGKSALMRRFLDEVRALPQPPLVLEGRCLERESVPFKAFDGIVEALARHLSTLDDAEVGALFSDDTTALAGAFPALARVPEVGRRIQGPGPAAGGEARARAFAGFRQLLARLAARRPLVLFIDDFQWADADSLALRRAMMDDGDAPGRALIVTLREIESLDEWLENALGNTAELLVDARDIRLGRLSVAEARQLVRARLGADAAGVEAIVAEAHGHPLLLDQLIEHGLERPGTRLEDALAQVIERLEPAARALLEVLGVAGAPLEQKTATRAAGLDGATFARVTAALRASHLVRTGGTRAADPIEPYHDQIRAAALHRISDEELPARHRALARALVETGHDGHPSLPAHWFAAGERNLAAHAAMREADRAFRALAFERAASLYRDAVTLKSEDAVLEALLPKLGLALSSVGRTADAAAAYLEAARRTGTSATEAIELQRRAAEQLLRGGRIDEGRAVLEKVLAGVGLRMAATPRHASFGVFFRRAQLRLRGVRFRHRPQPSLDPRALLRIDVSWSASVGLALVDPARGAAFQAQNLVMALGAGDPYRAARALALEAGYSASFGGATSERHAEILAEAERLARSEDHPHALALVATAHAIADVTAGRFASGYERVRAAAELLRTRCHDVTWELETLGLFAIRALALLGHLHELDHLVQQRLREAEGRGDLFALNNLTNGWANLAWLAKDDPRAARARARAAMAEWSQAGYHEQHFWALFSEAQIDLYEGAPAAALARLDAELPRATASQLLRVQFTRISARDLEARAALAEGARAEGGARRRLLRRARAATQELQRERVPWATALAALSRTGIALASAGERTDAARRESARAEAASAYGEAARALAAAGLALHAACARHRAAELAGDTDAATTTCADLSDAGVSAPEKMAALLVPRV